MVPAPTRGDSSHPPSNAPTIPTTTLSTTPCRASVRMTRLASQPMIPPTNNQTMRFMRSSLLGLQRFCTLFRRGKLLVSARLARFLLGPGHRFAGLHRYLVLALGLRDRQVILVFHHLPGGLARGYVFPRLGGLLRGVLLRVRDVFLNFPRRLRAITAERQQAAGQGCKNPFSGLHR